MGGWIQPTQDCALPTMVSSHAALLVLRVSSALALLMRLVGSSTAALLPVHRSRRWESRARSTARAASSASRGAPLEPWPVSSPGSLADDRSTCQSLTPLPSGRRSKVNQYENKSLIKIEHVNDKADTDFYMGKRCATTQIEQQ